MVKNVGAPHRSTDGPPRTMRPTEVSTSRRSRGHEGCVLEKFPSESLLKPVPKAPQEDVVLRPISVPAGGIIPPRARIALYSPDEWEKFTYEWVRELDDDYYDVQIVGGSGDHGIDVAAMLTERRLEGPWHCFQCKHYVDPLTPSDIWPEILKVLRAVKDGHYIMPERYEFVAPRGAGMKLRKLLNTPSKFKAAFLEQIQAGTPLMLGTPEQERSTLETLAKGTEFTRFDVANMDKVLEWHERSNQHHLRFEKPLPPLLEAPPPSDELDAIETRYVTELLEVYAEHHQTDLSTVELVREHPAAARDFHRQRVAFFSAESLRSFARDRVPSGTFQNLQTEILDGVIGQAESRHDSRMMRMRAVLDASQGLVVSSNALINVWRIRDRHGICHQLVNEERLTWRGES